ncbi:D-erythro-7,8-dihydroneopterin triphosphate epimerase [Oleiphilus sp. HI0009]|nr:dihydroneopterin triphosphate 2'-epimerase [Oleiphilus sp. HI0067]KZX76427.1 D-erythro-7,8-dihydroneopterin triphosphate epimerase [Oleiphilus sp. HI0009]KZY65685.1 D-erythro-7,8-dihydroneopterin triphosphate epimerase [Oleiphilus sp. HI0066]KZZ60578.1 D-erythro-7,8-dihydroneopterin triphosphate epimerase [Oleiphilus sp. HI0125]KZX84497.1 D-erythro-7,8-dihydroneopterin triphosphate epimerase [Oleiphilus sp. HI0009]KZY67623.1 D-erythro-7,8-dihydroneopterin triphosphate epimerase [Oleiphilus 
MKNETFVALQLARIHVENLRLRTFIGFNQEELIKQQDVVINLWIDYPAHTACYSDDHHDALDYKVITKAVINLVEKGHFKLLEKLCSDILDIIMAHANVQIAQVKVEKPHALRFADSVSVTLSATQHV